MTSKHKQQTAREYLRVSLDKSGTRRSTSEQHDENAKAAALLDVVLGTPYRDDNRSASRYATKAREDFDRLIADLEAGRFGADILWLWESSRGSRKVGEWVYLIELCAEDKILIHVTTHGRTYDPTNGRDRRSLLEDAVDSEYESSKISDRSKRTAAANAAAGKPHGRVPYGYRRRYDPVTRRLAAQELEPTEAANVRELFARIVAGHSLRGIATDWEVRGVTNKSGRPFTGAHLRSIARTRLYCGEREHTPGRKSGSRAAGKAPVSVVTGDWDALVPKATWLAVQRILSAPERRTSRPGRGIHLLSMIARCGVCSGVMTVTLRREEPQYECKARGHVRISKADLDDYAEKVMLGYLARPDVFEALTARDGEDQALAAVRDEIASIGEELDDLADKVGSGALSATLAARSEPGILARLKDAQDREAELTTPNVLRGLIAPGKDVRRRWKAAPMSTRREVARILLAPDLLGELRIVRTPTPRSTPPVQDRIEWRKATD